MTDVKLEVSDKEVPLNDFMKEMLTNILLGYLKTAKGMPDEIKSINITIQF